MYKKSLDQPGVPFIGSATSNVIDNIPETYLSNSTIHGVGLFAARNIGAGTLLAVLDGQIVSFDFYYSMRDRYSNNNDRKDIQDNIFMEWNCIPGDKLLCRMFRTKYSYINHSRTPNCKLIGNPPALWTYEDIREGHELTLDYREEPLPSAYVSGHGSSYL